MEGKFQKWSFKVSAVQRLLQTQRISERISNQDRILEEGRAVYRWTAGRVPGMSGSSPPEGLV